MKELVERKSLAQRLAEDWPDISGDALEEVAALESALARQGEAVDAQVHEVAQVERGVLVRSRIAPDYTGPLFATAPAPEAICTVEGCAVHPASEAEEAARWMEQQALNAETCAANAHEIGPAVYDPEMWLVGARRYRLAAAALRRTVTEEAPRGR